MKIEWLDDPETAAREGARIIAAAARAFNLFNHTNIFAVNTTAYNYTAPGGAGCPAGSNPAFNGCLVPNPVFRTPTSSSSGNGLFGARQIQLAGKIVF